MQNSRRGIKVYYHFFFWHPWTGTDISKISVIHWKQEKSLKAAVNFRILVLMMSLQTARLAPVAGQSVPQALNACHVLPPRHAATLPVHLDLMIPLWITRNHFLWVTRRTICWKIVTLALLFVQSRGVQDPSHPPGGPDLRHRPVLGCLVYNHYQVCVKGCIVCILRGWVSGSIAWIPDGEGVRSIAWIPGGWVSGCIAWTPLVDLLLSLSCLSWSHKHKITVVSGKHTMYDHNDL